jgi:hypothetical protein
MKGVIVQIPNLNVANLDSGFQLLQHGPTETTSHGKNRQNDVFSVKTVLCKLE